MTAGTGSAARAGLDFGEAMFRKGWARGDVLTGAEVPRDPALPQFAELLDGPAMPGLLGTAPPAGSAILPPGASECRVLNVRYRPGREAVVSYAVGSPDTAADGPPLRIVSARVMSEDLARRHLDKRLGAAGDAGVSFAHWPDRRLVVTVFPQDLRLATLHRLVEPAYFEGILRRVPGDDPARPVAPASGGPALTVVSYRPERSCLLRGRVRYPGTDGGEAQVVFARTWRDDRGDDIARVAAMLWNSPARRDGGLPVPEPLGYDPVSRTFLQRQVAGVPLSGLVSGAAETTGLFAAVGGALAALHASPVRLAPARPVAEGLDWMARMGRGLAGVQPDLGERLVDIAGRLRARLDPAGRPQCLVHGDFSMNQVLVAADRINLIDFDDAAMGDPHADLGTFLARMEWHFDDPAACDDAARAFRRGYSAARGGELDEARLDWHRAAGFVRLALSAAGQLRPGWPDKVARRLDRAGAMLEALAG